MTERRVRESWFRSLNRYRDQVGEIVELVQPWPISNPCVRLRMPDGEIILFEEGELYPPEEVDLQ